MYDVAILGGGPGGYAAALRAATRGAGVCCIEADKLGGTCLNTGCIPTKAMLHTSELMWNINHASDFGISAGRPGLDGSVFTERVHKIVGGLRKGVESLLKARKIDVVYGRGRLVDANTIAVDSAAGTKRIESNSVIIATGSRPARPSFAPWDSSCVMTTD